MILSVHDEKERECVVCGRERESGDGQTKMKKKVIERERSSLHRVILSMHEEPERVCV